MPATLPTASQTKSLHLLRSLLREASCLPDAAARDYFRRYIVARFKAYQPKPNATASFDVQAVEKYRHRSFKRRHIAIINGRAAQQQRKALKGLNFLRRANQGEGACIQKVLWLTYGRLGRRKYALLDELLKPDPAWPQGPAPLQLLYRSNLRCLQYFEAPNARNAAHGSHTIYISKQYPRLRAVITAQCQKEASLHRAMKRPYITTPMLNTWEQPMPIRRAVNNVRRWYAETMTRLLPALPTAEWDSIEAMSKGKQPIGFAKRRAPAVRLSPQPASDSGTLEQMLQRSLAMDKLSKADRPQGLDRPRALTARYMQRLYSRLLTLSCKLEYDDARKQWNAIWGEPRKNTRPDSYTTPVDDALFAGVDAKGAMPKAPKRKDKTAPLVQPRNEDGEYMRFPFFAEMLPETHPVRIELDKWKKERANARAKWVAPGGDAS
ncbi:hypothetical protein BU25DRAFT_414488 [Macroventuria anomochaeta]|uniref:Uncharacterized protein n=1 Tax=Macroventuria anomochaeta TaxID=301207 RepID=A0ACB6RMQ2_9PLEO|nr:uncharacterized protein BU25DRAFT_414488 [Macroventuria anomochaeta]KAF2623220.1 hypothetical protein BU25DRAFT_414488 [Macroventuria anomochaeta]